MDNYIGHIVNGAEFKKLMKDKDLTLIKYLESNDFSQPQRAHHGFHYKFGLNQVPENEVNLDPENECSGGGLYFTYMESDKWGRKYCYGATVPDDAQVLFEKNKKFKTDKLIISEFCPTEAEAIKIVSLNGLFLHYIKHQSEAICAAAFQQDDRSFAYVKKPTDKFCMMAVQKNERNICYVEQQTEELCLAAVARNGNVLQFVRNQTDKICMAAVQQEGSVLYFVKNQTDAICMAAVRQNGLAILYVKNKTKELCLEASKHNVEPHKYITSNILAV